MIDIPKAVCKKKVLKTESEKSTQGSLKKGVEYSHKNMQVIGEAAARKGGEIFF